MTATPPPLPDSRGWCKCVKSGGVASIRGLQSPSDNHVSVIIKKSKLLKVIKSWHKNDLLLSDLIFKRPKFTGLEIRAGAKRVCRGTWIKLLWFTAAVRDDEPVAERLWWEIMVCMGKVAGGGGSDRWSLWGELVGGKVLWAGLVGGEEGTGQGVCDVNSHSGVADWTACCMLAASIRLPIQLGWTPSVLNREERFQNKLKLSIKPILWALQADWSQELRPRILLKRPAPRASVGRGPLM